MHDIGKIDAIMKRDYDAEPEGTVVSGLYRVYKSKHQVLIVLLGNTPDRATSSVSVYSFHKHIEIE